MNRHSCHAALLLWVCSPAAQAQTGPTAPPAPKTASAPAKAGEDWPNLARYRDEDQALASPGANEQRVVFLGDSITDGWGRWGGTGAFFPGKPFVNRGISGQTTPQMLLRFQQDVVHLHPAAVVILAGTNDIAGNTGPSTPQMIEDNLSSMAELARANGIRVVLASITPVYRYPWRPALEPVAEVRGINSWMRTYCVSHGDVYLDYYDAMEDPQGAMLPGYSSDGVHPLARGYSVMTTLALAAIDRALQHP